MTAIRKAQKQYETLKRLQGLVYEARCVKRAWDEAGCNDAFSEDIGDTYLRDVVNALDQVEGIALRYGLWEKGVVG